MSRLVDENGFPLYDTAVDPNICREQTNEERIEWLQDENSRLINEIQKKSSDITMLKETIIKLAMILVGEER